MSPFWPYYKLQELVRKMTTGTSTIWNPIHQPSLLSEIARSKCKFFGFHNRSCPELDFWG
jgi:hypothetical protein